MKNIFTLLFIAIAFTSGAQTLTLVSNINPLASQFGAYPYNSSYATNYFAFNGKTFFTAMDSVQRGGLWALDTTPGAQPVLLDIKPYRRGLFSAPSNMTIFNNKIYYFDNDTNQHQVLCETDGTPAGTKIAADVIPGIYYTPYADLTVYNNKLIFAAYDVVHGYEPYISDGTGGGTHLLLDIIPGATGSNPTSFTVFNNLVYFACNDSLHGTELWVTDGTPGGTHILKDINPTALMGSMCQIVAVFNNKLIMSADDGVHGVSPWVSDGTEGGTQLMKNFSGTGVTASLSAFGFITNGNVFYFNAYAGGSSFPTWQSDGTDAGTKPATGFVGSTPGAFSYGKRIGDRFYFTKNTTPLNTIYYTNDAGTDTGRLGNYYYDYNLLAPNAFSTYHGKIYFVACDSFFNDLLWVTDGTKAGTHVVESPTQPIRYSVVETPPVECNNRLYFTAEFDTAIGYEPYTFVTPGTDPSFAPVVTVEPNSLSVYPNPSNGNFAVAFMAGGEARAQLQLVNLLGQQVYSKPLNIHEGINTFSINSGNVAKGICFLRITSGESSVTQKIIFN